MNKKVKGLSAALCGLVLMSGLLTTNVQAASNTKNVQTSYTMSSDQPMFGAMLSEDFRSDGTVQNAHITFNAIPGAVRYSCEYDDLISPTQSHAYTYNLTDTKVYVPIPKYNGCYYTFLTAYDSNNNVIRSEQYIYQYNNGNITLYYFKVLQ
jgi:hypothetical protein